MNIRSRGTGLRKISKPLGPSIYFRCNTKTLQKNEDLHRVDHYLNMDLLKIDKRC
jgi:hypothetical protein